MVRRMERTKECGGRMRKEKAVQGSFEDGVGLGRAGPEIRVRGA